MALAMNARVLALPARVRDLVARRLDRLGARSQQVAAVAAVIGRRFDFALLHSASGMEERDAAEAVEEMVRHHVLQAVGNQLDFTHDRVRDVAYGRLLAPRRRLLHRAVAEALEAVGAGTVDATGTPPRDRLGEQIEQLAHHALRGELWEKAVHYLRQAGAKAAARSALQDARVCLAQALDALELLPESPSTLEEAFEIRLELRPVLIQLGERDGLLQGSSGFRAHALSPRRYRDPPRSVRCRTWRGPLPRGAGPRRAARHAPARRDCHLGLVPLVRSGEQQTARVHLATPPRCTARWTCVDWLGETEAETAKSA